MSSRYCHLNISHSHTNLQHHLPMTSYPLSAPTAPRHRRSYTSIPQYDGSKDASDTPKEHKKHRSRHSLHHHLPHPYRRLKESQPPSSTALLGSNPFKQLTEKHENATAAIDDSKPQSGVVAVDGTSEAVAARELVQRQDIERERQRTEIRNKLVGLEIISRCSI